MDRKETGQLFPARCFTFRVAPAGRLLGQRLKMTKSRCSRFIEVPKKTARDGTQIADQPEQVGSLDCSG
jgi:hypothetical protein